jgi:ribosomal protein L11 methyltransferase
MAHIQITFADIRSDQQEWIIAHLAEAGFEGFEEKEDSLVAYIQERDFDGQLLKDIAFKYQLQYTSERIPDQNWNEVWESNFSPVILGDFVAVRADFHEPVPAVQHEIVITPKMSFGTGHHATTSMMLLQMRELPLSGKTVLDFGTGTGILAIMAEKLGAVKVTAIDNDNWSIENAKENIAKNLCSRIEVILADSLGEKDDFDVILANINRNVIVEQFSSLVQHLRKKGSLLLSGLLSSDQEDICDLADQYGLTLINHNTQGNWISMRFEK